MSGRNWIPGPWVKRFNGHYWDIGLANNSEVLPVYPTACIGVAPDQEAEADLIVAAPDLYAALDQALTSMQDSGYPGGHVVIRAGREAMAKARGES